MQNPSLFTNALPPYKNKIKILRRYFLIFHKDLPFLSLADDSFCLFLDDFIY